MKIYNSAVFHFVQAAEKALKALLYYKNSPAWGHSLLDLLKNCEKQGIKVSTDLKKIAKKLEKHYSSSRKTDAMHEKSPKDAYTLTMTEDIAQNAQKIMLFVKATHDNIQNSESTVIKQNGNK